MALEIYATMSGKKELFKPIRPNRINMFVCGPTVYDYSHLGHARTYSAFDVIVKYLRWKGYSVFYVVNITDVDDKMIARANEEGITVKELADKFTEAYFEDMQALGVDSVNLYAKATEHIPEIIRQVKLLVEKGYAYETETGIYYDVTKFNEYGKLSHQSLEDLRSAERIEVDETKKNPWDFSLWKKRKPQEPFWASPWGEGRPGWHIEDTAITETYLGQQYDIHGGARDLIFPHHECEIAQIEAISGKKPLVRYWVHTGFLTVGGEKMSKSLGNFITIREALEKWDAEVLRLAFLSSHYRSPTDFTEESVEQAEQSLKRLYNSLDNIKSLDVAERETLKENELELERALTSAREKFVEAMDNDFNTPRALAALFELARDVNRLSSNFEEISDKLLKKVLAIYKELGGIFGILQKEKEVGQDLTNNLVETIIEIRTRFREKGDWETADEIRSQLQSVGIALEDVSVEETRWKIER